MTPRSDMQARTHTLPPGRYYLGDPCYVIRDQDWGEYLRHWTQDLTWEDHPIAMFYTKHGDGYYPANNGHEYTVDSGIIGVVPQELVNPRPEMHHIIRMIDFDQEFECSQEDGVLRFGTITVRTE